MCTTDRSHPSSENVSSGHEAVGDCVNLRNAIEAAAQEKNISLTEFLSIPVKPLIDDVEFKEKKRRDPNTNAHKTKIRNLSDASTNKIHKRKAGRKANYYFRRRKT